MDNSNNSVDENWNVAELKIGDWVMLNGVPVNVRGVKEDDTVYLRCDGFDNRKDKRTYASFSDISPMPLTLDILNKNLFTFKDGEEMFSKSDDSLHLKYIQRFKLFNVMLPCNNSETEKFVMLDTIEYVHQFQHYLSIFGYNSNIQAI